MRRGISRPFRKCGGAELHGQLPDFLKNLSSIGGLLLLPWVVAGGKSKRASAE